MNQSETELVKALTKATQRIQQLCATVNALHPKKVRTEDFLEGVADVLAKHKP